MTLDDARDAFEDTPNADTAADYVKTAREYCDDGVIADATLDAVLRRCAPLLSNNKDA